MICALCKRRLLTAAVTIGAMPIGPKCARRVGLMPLAARKTGAVRPAYRRSATWLELAQLDLFGDAA